MFLFKVLFLINFCHMHEKLIRVRDQKHLFGLERLAKSKQIQTRSSVPQFKKKKLFKKSNVICVLCNSSYRSHAYLKMSCAGKSLIIKRNNAWRGTQDRSLPSTWPSQNQLISLYKNSDIFVEIMQNFTFILRMLCELQAGEVHGSGFKCDVVDLR